jgi:SAM-dependent methyltransferase
MPSLRDRDTKFHIVRLTTRLKNAWHRHGPAGFIWLVGYNIVYHIVGRYHMARAPSEADVFDRKYGTDTRGIREIGSLDVGTVAAARSAVRYQPSNAKLVWTTLNGLRIDYSLFSFVDFGSGKGRALLVAAEFPFKEVLGIEFSRELHEIALENIRRLPPKVVRAGRVLSIHGEACAFELPKSDLVCYFYNPFGEPVIAQVVGRLVTHYDRYGHQIIIIYHDPRHREIFEDTKKFANLEETSDTLVMATLRRDFSRIE